LRKMKDGWTLFVGAPGLSSELVRIAARKANVHLYTQTDCNVYANGPIVALHASQDGPVTVDAGRRGQIHDVLTGALIGTGPVITLPMKKGDTRVLR
jgi:beta-galactosidase